MRKEGDATQYMITKIKSLRHVCLNKLNRWSVIV